MEEHVEKTHGEKTRRESRREKRKEARLLKRKNRLESWVQHHKINVKRKSSELEGPLESPNKLDVSDLLNEPAYKNELTEKKREVSKKPPKKTKSKSFLGIEMEKDTKDIEMEKDTKDIEMERKLARKLKVKGGKLGGVDDNLNDLFADISYVLDPGVEDKASPLPSGKKCKKKKKSSEALDKKSQDLVHDLQHEESELAPLTRELATADTAEQFFFSEKKALLEEANAQAAKYVAPHLRGCTRMESEEFSQICRRIRGLLNRLSESNVESITGEVASIFRSLTRSDGCCIIGEEVMSSCFDGPRGNEQHASVFAAFVAGMACLVGMDFSAKLLASLAMAFENEYVKEDNLSLRNIALLLSYLYILGVCSSDLIYDFLSLLSKRMSELDVSTVLAVLQCCGMKLRSDDPSGMKDFILNIQNRVSELKCSSGTAEAQPKISSKRMEFMLETICEIKNNKKRDKQEPAHHTRIKKWLQRLKADDILLRGIKWSKLLDTEKKGQWWVSGETASTDNTVENIAVSIDKETLEAQKLIQLAARQRMNTDIRRAIFCVIMSGEDYLDAFEKILRLNLSGKQDREIMRVLVECCLQEKLFNKYYFLLAAKLCSHNKNHKFTLQYCLWDHFKEVESMEQHRSVNLAKLVAELLSSFTLSLALLKAVDLMNLQQLTPNKITHFRMLFQSIFENPDSIVWNIFTRVAALPEREILGQNLEFFIRKFVITGDSGRSFAAKFQIAKKALENVAGVLM